MISVQGIENIRNEIQDTMEPLIDPVHGHGRYKNTSLHQLSSSVRLTQELLHYWKVLFLCGKGYSTSCVFSETLDVSFLIYLFSQSLVNLLVTGHAVSNVWDGDRECSGMSKTSMKLLNTHTNTPYSHSRHMHTYQTHRTQLCGPRFKPYPPEGNNSCIPQQCTKDTN